MTQIKNPLKFLKNKKHLNKTFLFYYAHDAHLSVSFVIPFDRLQFRPIEKIAIQPKMFQLHLFHMHIEEGMIKNEYVNKKLF